MLQSYQFLEVEGIEETRTRRRIRHLRRLILVHSCIYYGYNDSIIPDHLFDEISRELVSLQERFPKISKSVEFYETFKFFDGSSGYDLDWRHPEILKIVNYLLKGDKSTVK